MTEERITLAWWNTGLSPGGKSRQEPSDFSIAQQVIDHLLDDLNVDFCALGEISSTDVNAIREYCNAREYAIHSGIEFIGRSSFSTCFLVNEKRFSFQLHEGLVVKRENSNYRLAQKATLLSLDKKSLFHLFISHWPSRLHPEAGAGAPLRSTLGERLREYVDIVFDDNPSKNIILIGDYNDEPFDASLSYHLRATRDRDLIKKKLSLLYNPFWRHFCHPNISSQSLESTVNLESWGTSHHKGGSLFQWRTFDQMMFSSSFLTSGLWRLNEAITGIINLDTYTSLVAEHKTNYDHLPIIATLERNING